MQCNLAFYVHHHGSGHIMRCIAIARQLTECKVTFLGSNLKPYSAIIPDNISCIHLSADVPMETDRYSQEPERIGVHYAPLNIAGQAGRVQQLTAFFAQQTSLVLVVDVSAEVAMLATLAGIPTIIVRQHGHREDLPHRIAYGNAFGLLAPFGKHMLAAEESWITEKTFFSGGFSRFATQQDEANLKDKEVAILVGSGGTSLNGAFLQHISSSCPDWNFRVIGNTRIHAGPNIICHGTVNDPLELLQPCAIIIGNAGHNTVMEVASLNKRFVVIPEARPFDEQLQKADLLAKLNLARVVQPKDLYQTNWQAVLDEVGSAVPDWSNTIDSAAPKKAAAYLKQAYLSLYPEQ